MMFLSSPLWSVELEQNYKKIRRQESKINQRKLTKFMP